MAKRGPKPRPPEMQLAVGETRPSRKVTVLFEDHASRPDPEVIAAPKWLSGAAKRVWAEKVDRYRQRAQKVSGFEDALAQYCALEAEIIAIRKKRDVPTVAMINAHRIWAAEFYDTPASQVARPGSTGTNGNQFAKFGKRNA